MPLPEAEQYRLSVQRKRREVIDTQTTKAGRLIPRLLDADALTIGDTLYFRRSALPPGVAPPWSKEEPLYRAELATGEGTRTLRWTDPDTGQAELISPSLAAARLLHRFGQREGEVSSEGVNGMI